MPFSPKEAAESLMKLADTLENEAMNASFMVCKKCRHTASLSTINGRRLKAASEMSVKNVNTVTVNDKVACPACSGTMSYVPTDKSSRYYVEAAEGGPLDMVTPPDSMAPAEPPPAEEDEKNKKILPPEGESEPQSEPAPMDHGDIFDPVDERDKNKGEGLDLGFGDEDVDSKKPEDAPPTEDMPPTDGVPEDMPPAETDNPDMPPVDGKPADMPPTDEGQSEDMPLVEDKPEDMPPTDGELPPAGEMGPDGEQPPVVEETVPGDLGSGSPESDLPELEAPKKPKKKKDEVEFPKKDVPKFEKMPKEASDSGRLYEASLKKYMF
jgi:hypothetical protein